MLTNSPRQATSVWGDDAQTRPRIHANRELQEAHERAEGVRLLFLSARADLHKHMEHHGCEMLSRS